MKSSGATEHTYIHPRAVTRPSDVPYATDTEADRPSLSETLEGGALDSGHHWPQDVIIGDMAGPRRLRRG